MAFYGQVGFDGWSARQLNLEYHGYQDQARRYQAQGMHVSAYQYYEMAEALRYHTANTHYGGQMDWGHQRAADTNLWQAQYNWGRTGFHY